MKYNLKSYGTLIISNDLGMRIFTLNKYNNWGKSDYDHKGKEVYFETSDGYINNYNDEI